MLDLKLKMRRFGVVCAALVASYAWAVCPGTDGSCVPVPTLLQTKLDHVHAPMDVPTPGRRAPLEANSSHDVVAALSEAGKGEGTLNRFNLCSVLHVPNGCSCAGVDRYRSKVTCSKMVHGPTGSNTFSLVADIKPCVGPPTIVMTGTEHNTGHSFSQSVTALDVLLGVGVPGLSMSLGVAATGMKLVASVKDLGNARVKISLELDACSSLGPWWASIEACGSHLSADLPIRLLDLPTIDFSHVCQGKTASDGAPVQIWNPNDYNKCLVTSRTTGYMYWDGCSDQESAWTWTVNHTFQTKQSGKCLQTYVWSDGHTYAKTSACTGNSDQTWDWRGDLMISRASGKCLSIHQVKDAGWADIILQLCDSKWYQRWVWSLV